MKASEMTNDELANDLDGYALETDAKGWPTYSNTLRETAARLREYDAAVSMYSDEMSLVNALRAKLKELVSLRAKLKVAEDALGVVFKNTAYGERFFSTTCEFVHEKAKNALAAIKKEGGVK